VKPPVIEARSLSRIYQTGDVVVQALRNASFCIDEGDFVAIMGPSGSGKSTTMNILGCLDKPTGGSYLLDGVEVSSLDHNQLAAIRNKKIGFVFQGFNLLARTTALENVEVPLLYGDYPSASERIRLARESLEKVKLGQRLDHVPTQMSGGEQQRVAIARAMVTKPSLILADEPTGNLDSRTSAEILRLFQELNEKEGLTIVLVTHEPDIAKCCRRIISFRDGRVRRDEAVSDRTDAAKLLDEMQREDED
jgi:putative ABC transport system ATP-binding protein